MRKKRFNLSYVIFNWHIWCHALVIVVKECSTILTLRHLWTWLPTKLVPWNACLWTCISCRAWSKLAAIIPLATETFVDLFSATFCIGIKTKRYHRLYNDLLSKHIGFNRGENKLLVILNTCIIQCIKRNQYAPHHLSQNPFPWQILGEVGLVEKQLPQDKGEWSMIAAPSIPCAPLPSLPA